MRGVIDIGISMNVMNIHPDMWNVFNIGLLMNIINIHRDSGVTQDSPAEIKQLETNKIVESSCSYTLMGNML